MADQTIAIRLILQDELSKPLADIHARLRRLDSAVNTAPARAQLQLLGRGVQAVHREFSALSRIALGGLVGGGAVAGIYATIKALGDMARQGLQLHYTAQSLGTSSQFIERYSDALMGLGQTQEQARASIEGALGTLRDFQVEGGQSSLFQVLERGAHGSGIRLAREIRATMMGPGGVEEALRLVLHRMQGMEPEAQRRLSRALGMSTTAAKDYAEILPQLNKRVQLNTTEMRALTLANANFEISMGNIGRMLGSAVMPGITKVTEAFSKYLQTDAGKKFADELRGWSESIGTAIGKWIEEGGLKTATDEFKKIVEALGVAFEAADKTIQAMGISWPQVLGAVVATNFGAWLISVGVGLGAIAKIPNIGVILRSLGAAGTLLTLLMSKEEIRRQLQEQREEGAKEHPEREKEFKQFGGVGVILDILIQMLKGNIDLLGKGAPMSGEDTPKTEQERRSDLSEEKRERDALTREFKELHYDMAKLNDFLIPGGPEGGGGSSGFLNPWQPGGDPAPGYYDARGLPHGEPGPGRKPFPVLSKAATPLPWSLGSFLSGVSEGRGLATWFGQGPGWRDPGDKPGSNRLGVPEHLQGLSLSSASTLGQFFYAKDPNTGLTSVQQQTDIGPGVRTQKLVDMSVASLQRLGYTKESFQAQQGKRLWSVENAGFGTGTPTSKGASTQSITSNPAWAGRSGGFDELGSPLSTAPFSSGFDEEGFAGGGITDFLAGQAARFNGSATIDIDIGGLGRPARNPNDLFPAQLLEGATQMQNAPPVKNDPLNFQ